ncbi:UNVERIFIED_CONTAM: putative disease resistance protein RGA3 [Sesamum latifolium]|uniref:Disease resistance protein RGA3 n=1 Tax=Sesamum latifolium TaxID=2727402 RepID=A0AAW2UFP0_9LAMI
MLSFPSRWRDWQISFRNKSKKRDVLEDAEKRGYKDKTVQNWLRKLEDVAHDIDDVLDEWNYALLKLQIENSSRKHKLSSCLCLNKVATRRDIATKIKGLKEKLDLIVAEKERYGFIISHPVVPQASGRVHTTSFVDVSEIHGREADKDTLVNKLMLHVSGQQEVGGARVISVVGTGGIGKTTLAQLVHNDNRLVNCFELRIWVCVSDVFDEVRIVKAILEMVMGNSPDVNELEALLNRLKKTISGKTFLLILDDVWTEERVKWEPLKHSLNFGAPGSKILVTTRSERVARAMGTVDIHSIDVLSDKDCWMLMKHVAFHGRSEEDCEELQEIGKRIANKCKGLPLAAKVLGSLLHFKETKEEWQSILDSEIWQLEEAEVELFPHLFLSYNELSMAMKQCFSYCAIFPKDSEIDVEKLIRMWMALGYLSSTGSIRDLELRGKEYFNNLKMRSFFQDLVVRGDAIYCKMHDIVHDFAQFLRNTKTHDPNESVGASLASHVKAYRSFFCQNELPLELFTSITGLRVLLSSCEFVLPEVPRGIENLIHLRYLDLNGNESLVLSRTICELYNLQTLYLSDCDLKEIPSEIGNLIHLRHLDLSKNSLTELPETICNLQDLETLNVAYCEGLSALPDGINGLVSLRHLPNDETKILYKIPQGFEQLTGLQTLKLFHAGRDWSKLGYLKKLDQLSGSLELRISLHDREDVDEARNAQLRNKIHIKNLAIWFIDAAEGEELVRNEAMEALQPPPNLQHLTIQNYQGTVFPGWISSCLNHLRRLHIQGCDYISTLPCLGKLPELEEVSICRMEQLKFVGREFLGIAAGSMGSSGGMISFPKLKTLSFSDCTIWEEWEDIRGEADGMSIMPCLRELKIDDCG